MPIPQRLPTGPQSVARKILAAALAASMLSLAACGGTPPLPAAETSSGDALPLVRSLDPSKARVHFLQRPQVAPATLESALSVPGFSLGFERADYIQLMRCRSDYRLTTTTGIDLRSETLVTAFDAKELKWVWFNALAETGSCVLVGTRISREKYQDLAAKSGEFYYVANPCVDSPGKEAACSYVMEVSGSVSYQNNLSARFLSLASELSGLEAGMGAKFDRLKALAVEVQSKQDKCEGDYAKTEAGKDFLRGLGSLALIGTGAAIGGFISGGSAAIMGGKAGLNLAIWLFSKPRPVMGCPLVSKALAEAKTLSDALELNKVDVVKLRIEMAGIESSYAKLDEEILKDL